MKSREKNLRYLEGVKGKKERMKDANGG